MKQIIEKEKISRKEIQDKALDFSKKYNNMVLLYPTGLGKSYTIIKILDYLFKTLVDFKCLILEEEIAVLKNFKKEFEKFGKSYLLEKIDMICYASLKKVENKYSIMILDEAHHVFTEKRLDLFSNLTPKHIYLLSATLENSQIKQFEKILNCDFLVHKVYLKKAIEWGILPTPKINIFRLKLNEEKINCYYEYSRGKKKEQITITVNEEKYKWKYMKDKKNYPNLHLIVYCTEKQKYNQLCYLADYAKEQFLKNQDNNKEIKKYRDLTKEEIEDEEKLEKYWLYSELCIKRFLSEIKSQYLDEFLKDVIKEEYRFIAFLGSVNQAKQLAEKHNSYLVASENKDSQKNIEAFNNKKISSLYVVKMLNEGVTLKDLEIAILAQLDGKSRSFIQKVGRSLRSIYPLIYIFYYEKTKDEKYLSNCLKNINKKDIEYLDYFYN